MTLSIWKQAEYMRREWPTFKVLRRTRWWALWEGALRPLSQTYTVQVLLQRDRNRKKAAPARIPLVVVIDPLLRRRFKEPSDPIPHHYPNPEHPELPFLCLYDPKAPKREWHPRLAVSRTIVPWTIDWLACYEGWLATGEWTGGGRH